MEECIVTPPLAYGVKMPSQCVGAYYSAWVVPVAVHKSKTAAYALSAMQHML